MKQVINNRSLVYNQELYIDISEINSEHYFGIEVRHLRGFITQTDYQKGNFCVLSALGLTMGNQWDSLRAGSFENVVELLLSYDFKVFMFNTYQELFRWLSEGTRHEI
jgi:hypothetical protein